MVILGVMCILVMLSYLMWPLEGVLFNLLYVRKEPTNVKRCPYPDCRFAGTDDEVDDHRIAAHSDEPQAGSNR